MTDKDAIERDRIVRAADTRQSDREYADKQRLLTLAQIKAMRSFLIGE